jgi:NADP-dependent 3-hydroxy acid dehydrogenase YdfG
MRAVLVTGASRGIGRAIATAFAENGDRVAIHHRSSVELATQLRDGLPGRGHVVVQADIADPAAVQQMVSAAADQLGGLDVLVNNAGLMLSGPIVGADTSEWTRMVHTNLLGSMYVAHAALPHLLESKGTLVQVSSTSGRIASAGSGVYSATKFGINAFSEALRQEVTARGVRVVVIEPGFVATELADHISDPAMRARAREMAGSMRVLQPEDVANAVLYAATQPDHVAVNEIMLRPADQAV